jgi:hypothetical protein
MANRLQLEVVMAGPFRFRLRSNATSPRWRLHAIRASPHRSARVHPASRRFLGRFSDNFGTKFEPAVLLVHSSAPPAFRGVSAWRASAISSRCRPPRDRRPASFSNASTRSRATDIIREPGRYAGLIASVSAHDRSGRPSRRRIRSDEYLDAGFLQLLQCQSHR